MAEQVHLGGALLHGDDLPAQVLDLGHPRRVAALHHDRRPGAEVVHEVVLPGALRRVGHRRHGQVQVSPAHLGQQLREVGLHEPDLQPENVPDLRAEVRLHTDDGAPVRPEGGHRRVRRVGADPQDAPVEHRLGQPVSQGAVHPRLVGLRGPVREGRVAARAGQEADGHRQRA
jgi:hypothetical protein